MTKSRIVETNEGIIGDFNVEIYDQFSRNMRDKGLLETNNIIKLGIDSGHVLEVGPGPGYVGLEWLSKTTNSKLTACEISSDMINLAKKNAADYELTDRTNYVECSCLEMPFDNNSFDAVFTCGSLHEWEHPIQAFNDIHRVLKPNAHFTIMDLRRDINPIVKWIMYFMTKPKEIRPGFITSINASYTAKELRGLFLKTKFRNFKVKSDLFGLTVFGTK